jgi:hypothetical protein
MKNVKGKILNRKVKSRSKINSPLGAGGGVQNKSPKGCFRALF